MVPLIIPANAVPVRDRDKIGVRYRASASPAEIAMTIQFMDRRGDIGELGPINIRTFTANRTSQLDPLSLVDVPKNGWIVDAHLDLGGAIKRGQVYAIGFVLRGGNNRALMKGYLYDYGPIPLGVFVEPLDGPGYRGPLAIADNIAPVDIQHTLGIADARRRIDGFAWYYHCSGDVADRTLRASMRDMGSGLPTGMTSGDNTTVKAWPSAGVLTLSANQEGFIYVNANTGKSFAASVDNGVITVENITTDPDPFPYWAQEDDVAEIFFNVTLAEAADRHSIYIFQEEWIEA